VKFPGIRKIKCPFEFRRGKISLLKKNRSPLPMRLYGKIEQFDGGFRLF
jgi:hypothetical protein